MFDVTIVQRLKRGPTTGVQQQRPYLTEYVEGPPARVRTSRSVVGTAVQFTRVDRGYRLVFDVAMLRDDSTPGGRCEVDAQAPREWVVADDIDLTGVIDYGATDERWLITPQDLVERVADDPVLVVGHIDPAEDGREQG